MSAFSALVHACVRIDRDGDRPFDATLIREPAKKRVRFSVESMKADPTGDVRVGCMIDKHATSAPPTFLTPSHACATSSKTFNGTADVTVIAADATAASTADTATAADAIATVGPAPAPALDSTLDPSASNPAAGSSTARKSHQISLGSDARSVLQNWVDENLEDPYPSVQQKLELVASAGLTMTQVNDWLTNFRKRHWESKIRPSPADEAGTSAGSVTTAHIAAVQVGHSARAALIARQRRQFSLGIDACHILKSWVDDNLEKPYPSVRQKLELGASAGLSMKQVNDWFTNFRKRHWGRRDGGQVEGRHLAENSKT